MLALPMTSAHAAPRRTGSHQVRAGENLTVIAKRYGTTPEKLASLNRISLNATLRMGRALRVPVRARPAPRAVARRSSARAPRAVKSLRQATPQAPVARATVYVVRAGDSLWKLAS